MDREQRGPLQSGDHEQVSQMPHAETMPWRVDARYLGGGPVSGWRAASAPQSYFMPTLGSTYSYPLALGTECE